jgi:hypothetical protein
VLKKFVCYREKNFAYGQKLFSQKTLHSRFSADVERDNVLWMCWFVDRRDATASSTSEKCISFSSEYKQQSSTTRRNIKNKKKTKRLDLLIYQISPSTTHISHTKSVKMHGSKTG